MTILAQAVFPATLDQWVIVAILVCAVIVIGVVAPRQPGVAIPPLVVTTFRIVAVALVAILANKFLVSMV